MAEISHFLDDCGRLWKLKWRPEPESNRRIRICSPLRHHSAIGPRRGWPQMCGFWCKVKQGCDIVAQDSGAKARSEEHTSELQSLMRISYAVFCLKKKKTTITIYIYTTFLLYFINH